jgi:hypothetical protein
VLLLGEDVPLGPTLSTTSSIRRNRNIPSMALLTPSDARHAGEGVVLLGRQVRGNPIPFFPEFLKIAPVTSLAQEPLLVKPELHSLLLMLLLLLHTTVPLCSHGLGQGIVTGHCCLPPKPLHTIIMQL